MQYLVPNQQGQAVRLRMAGVLDVSELLLKYPLAFHDARILYPVIKECDMEWLCGAMGLAVELMGSLDAKMFLEEHPEIFLFSSLCCWAYCKQLQKSKLVDPYYEQRQYSTMINTLASVGYSQAVCEDLIARTNLHPHAKAILTQQYRNSLVEETLVVYPFNAEAQQATVH